MFTLHPVLGTEGVARAFLPAEKGNLPWDCKLMRLRAAVCIASATMKRRSARIWTIWRLSAHPPPICRPPAAADQGPTSRRQIPDSVIATLVVASPKSNRSSLSQRFGAGFSSAWGEIHCLCSRLKSLHAP